MWHAHSLGKFALFVCAGMLAIGCLTEDDRPPPGKMVFRGVADAALRDGFSTEDGWTIRYERFIASLGHASPEECTMYSDSAYNRILDLRLEGPQHLSVIYALGPCQIDYELSSPNQDSLLGAGVPAEVRDFMRTPGSDDIAKDAGVSIHLRGVATKNGIEKRFEWIFRNRIDYTNCSQTVDGQLVQGIDLSEDEQVNQDLVVHGGALFQDHQKTTKALLVFDPFAAADDVYGDGDGNVTLDELGKVPLADIAIADRFVDADNDWQTLEEYVYVGSLRNVVTFGVDGTWDNCEEFEIFPNDRAPH